MIRVSIDPGESVVITGVGALKRDLVVTNRNGELESTPYYNDEPAHERKKPKGGDEEFVISHVAQPPKKDPKTVTVNGMIFDPDWYKVRRIAFLKALAYVQALPDCVLSKAPTKNPNRCTECSLGGQSPSPTIGQFRVYKIGEWSWEEEVFHYVSEHDERPSDAFVSFILKKSKSIAADAGVTISASPTKSKKKAR